MAKNRDEVAVLVVEDIAAMRIQIKDLLSSFGFKKVKLASNPEDAKSHLATDKFDLILADWLMEPTDGLDLLRHVRLDPINKDVAFIMVTAEGTKERVISAIQSGVDDYLLKPLTIAQVQTKVYSVLLKKKVL